MVTQPNASRGARKRIRTGIALSATELCAADIRLRGQSGGVWRASLEPLNGDSAWPSLASALARLAATLGVSDGLLAVSLMPPLTEVRRLDLPPLRDEELQRLLTRNASRYFVNARGPQVVGASWIHRKKRGSPAPIVATAASARLVAAVRAAAAQSGWTVESISPAEAAWSAGARSLWPVFARGEAHVIIAHDDRADILHMEAGQLVGVRRFRGGATDAGMIADALGPTARVGIAGDPAASRQLAAALEQFGVRALAPSERGTGAERSDALAAQFAGDLAGPVLRSEGAAAVEHARATRLALVVAGAAAALLLASAGLELWGVKHQLQQVRDQRAALRGQVSATLVGRSTLDAMYRQVAALNAAERTSPRWSTIIAGLSEAVPQDAYLTAIRTRQDSLVIDGLGEHAARVFDGLANAPGIVDVRAAAPVRREVQDDGSALEHFTIAARVEPSAQRPPTTAPAANRQNRRPSQ